MKRRTLLLKPVEAADELQVSRAQTYRMIKSGEIPSVKVGAQLRVPSAGLQDWVTKQATPNGDPPSSARRRK
jgi:excisionase family DNA binding protein